MLFTVTGRHFNVCVLVLEVVYEFCSELSKLWNLMNFLSLFESLCDYVGASCTTRQETVLGDDNLMNGFETFIKDESL